MMDSIGPIRVLVLETEAQILANARAALEGDHRLVLVATVSDQTSLLDKLGSTYAHVAVIDIAGLRGDVGPAVHEILAHAPECCVIVTGSNVAPGVVSRAVTAGARGFLLKPYQPEDFVSTIRDAYVNFQDLRRLQRIERVPGTTSRPGAVIAVYSPNGGVGCTTLATLRMADRVILVTTPELPALRNLRRVMSATGLLLQDDRTILVANRVPGKAGISLSEIEKGLGRSIAATIPSEGVGITEAINRGMSILDERARAKAGGSYRKLADLVAVGLEPAAVSRARRAVPATS